MSSGWLTAPTTTLAPSTTIPPPIVRAVWRGRPPHHHPAPTCGAPSPAPSGCARSGEAASTSRSPSFRRRTPARAWGVENLSARRGGDGREERSGTYFQERDVLLHRSHRAVVADHRRLLRLPLGRGD